MDFHNSVVNQMKQDLHPYEQRLTEAIQERDDLAAQLKMAELKVRQEMATLGSK